MTAQERGACGATGKGALARPRCIPQAERQDDEVTQSTTDQRQQPEASAITMPTASDYPFVLRNLEKRLSVRGMPNELV